MQTPSSSRLTSIASTPAHSRHSRSCSHASGLSDQICQILCAELQRGRDRHHRSSSYRRSFSSSRGSSDSQSSPRSDRSHSSGSHRRHARSRCSPHRSRHVRSHWSVCHRVVGTHVARTPYIGVTARTCLTPCTRDHSPLYSQGVPPGPAGPLLQLRLSQWATTSSRGLSPPRESVLLCAKSTSCEQPCPTPFSAAAALRVQGAPLSLTQLTP